MALFELKVLNNWRNARRAISYASPVGKKIIGRMGLDVVRLITLRVSAFSEVSQIYRDSSCLLEFFLRHVVLFKKKQNLKLLQCKHWLLYEILSKELIMYMSLYRSLSWNGLLAFFI